MSLASVRALSYTYPGAHEPALSDVSLDLEAGQLVVVAGASGSGKSTLLRVLCGLVPHFHGGTISGRVNVAGLDTRTHRPADLAEHVGTLFQDPETQIVMGTVRAELGFAVQNRGWAPAAVARAVEETALALALDRLLERPTAELSGGELQRVALGATLVGRPQLVCLDEPASQLDPVAGEELISLLRRLNEDQDLTVLLVEHRLERCLQAADRVLSLDQGRLAFDGPPSEFLAWALTHAPQLATPGARLLARAHLQPAAGVKASRARLRAAHMLPLSDTVVQPPPDTAVPSVPDAADAAVPDAAVPTAPDTAVPTAPDAAVPTAPDAAVPAMPEGDARRLPLHAPRGRRRHLRRAHRAVSEADAALCCEHVWQELRNGPVILRDLSLTLARGEHVALMGRNGAGKSTLLRHAANLIEPTRGSVRAGGRVALLLQNPTDYLVHDTVAQEATPAALARFRLTQLTRRHPRDLSGGEKQRLALAIVVGDGVTLEPPALLCLDEPTRGMDRSAKDSLAATLAQMSCAVLVATHDPEFAARFAQRVVLIADGTVIADASAHEILSGGAYFATVTARILGGAGGALLPEDGARLLARARSAGQASEPGSATAGHPDPGDAPAGHPGPDPDPGDVSASRSGTGLQSGTQVPA